AGIKAVSGIASIPLILDVVCRVTGMGCAAVARLTGDRWIVCSVDDRIGFGLTTGDALPPPEDVKSYISQPIHLRDGTLFGALCAVDPSPRAVDRPEIAGMFRLFAELIAQHLSTDERLAASRAQLIEAQESAELREQFMAVLGHDLRNPLAAIASGVGLLQRSVPADDDRGQRVLQMMQQCSLRMSE